MSKKVTKSSPKTSFFNKLPKAAWFGIGGVLLAAIVVVVIFLLIPSDSPSEQPDHPANLPPVTLTAASMDGKWGFVNPEGLWDVTPIYEDVKPFDKTRLAAVKKSGFWGFVDENGTEIIPPVYEEVQNFSNGLAAVCENGRWVQAKISVSYQSIPAPIHAPDMPCFPPIPKILIYMGL